jgi:hypothetical protein
MLSELASGAHVPPEKLAYFQERTRNRLHAYILNKFIEKEIAGVLSRAELARRIGRKPEVISRMLGAPGNWTIGTISDLLIGIAAEELEPTSSSLLGRASRNYKGPTWLNDMPVWTSAPPPPPGATSGEIKIDTGSRSTTAPSS